MPARTNSLARTNGKLPTEVTLRFVFVDNTEKKHRLVKRSGRHEGFVKKRGDPRFDMDKGCPELDSITLLDGTETLAEFSPNYLNVIIDEWIYEADTVCWDFSIYYEDGWQLVPAFCMDWLEPAL